MRSYRKQEIQNGWPKITKINWSNILIYVYVIMF